MLHHLDISATASTPDTNLNHDAFNPGTLRRVHESPTGHAIFLLSTSQFGVPLLIGAVVSAPSRPPVIALEPFVLRLVGPDGFQDEVKQYTGRVVRWIIEQLGGRWVRRGVKITVVSLSHTGSIYTFR